MEVKFENNSCILRNIGGDFSPPNIFDNGQCFRFFDVGGGTYEGVAHGRFLRVRKDGENTVLYPVVQKDFDNIWQHYFDLKRDYSGLFADVDDAALQKGISYANGLRVLNQQSFEVLISFIISANNNVKRIRGIISKICQCSGTPFDFEGKRYYAFPTPKQLSKVTTLQLAECGCGYRAPYVAETAARVADGFNIEELKRLPYAEAKKELITLKGVGGKVADCVLLFGLGFSCAFPADVWVKRVLKNVYGFTGNERQIEEFARKKYGKLAGIAQQYLFYYARENGCIF